jgi:hypothetical protein
MEKERKLVSLRNKFELPEPGNWIFLVGYWILNKGGRTEEWVYPVSRKAVSM